MKKITIISIILILGMLPSALALTYIYPQSNTAIGTQTPRAGYWTTVNADPYLQNPDAWVASTWNQPQEGNTIFPTMTMYNGIATTKLYMYAGNNIWDSTSYKQDIYQGPSYWSPASLNIPQRITYIVKSDYENLVGSSYFNLFFEVWATFDSPTGSNNAVMAEMMIQQRIITKDYGSSQIGEYQYFIGQYNHYVITYRAPDIPYNQWTTKTYDLNSLLYSQLQNIYGCDLSKGKIYALIFGIEGHSDNGGMGAQWETVNLEKYLV